MPHELVVILKLIAEGLDELKKLLVGSLGISSAINFDKLKVQPQLPVLKLGDLDEPIPMPQWSRYEPRKTIGFLLWFRPLRTKYRERLEKAQRAFEDAKAYDAQREFERQSAIARVREAHERAVSAAHAKADRHNAEVDAWRVSFEKGEREAVEEYYSEVLSRSAYPEEFPQEFRLAYVGDSKQLVVEYDFPLLDAIIPKVKRFTYVKSSDTVNESPRPGKERRSLYACVIAQTTMRCLHELFAASTRGVVETIVFSGFVETIHSGTGQGIHPCLVTVRTTVDQFSEIDLSMAEPSAALQTLNASFSKSPAELAPVRPLLEFSMVDPRFIQESDVLSTLDQRRNLMDLSPGEFESLITNLFRKMGLETRLTQASRDGGVDCVAYDPRPVFGGKVVIQAKRYKNTVGVSAVRDLFGTMQNEGASKGILVTTSGYGKAAFQFAGGKPLELLDGSHLRFLLKEHAGIDARIVMPDDWKDSDMDSGA
jgi:restriction system protein